ncbi:MAG: hypothetical protein CR958_00095 [Rhodobacterales bacterium]|nr:MAG: hypothetical protein CR958_00095 [Rhodobacterales bacterium]
MIAKNGTQNTLKGHEKHKPENPKALIFKESAFSGTSDTYSRPQKTPAAATPDPGIHKRLDKFSRAVIFAYSQDWPLTIGLTVSWDALLLAGEHDEGHCLGRDPWDREKYLRRELCRLSRHGKRPFVSLWGRDVGRRLGEHVHLSVYWPSGDLERVVRLISRVTGSRSEFVHAPYTIEPVARSVCGGWQINLNTRSQAGALDWASYIAHQHDKHTHAPNLQGRAFGISRAINAKAQRCAGFIPTVGEHHV